MFKEIITQCKQAYKEKNMLVASELYERIYCVLDEERDKLTTQEDKDKIFKEYMESMEMFTNDEIYNITDYLKEKYYHKRRN